MHRVSTEEVKMDTFDVKSVVGMTKSDACKTVALAGYTFRLRMLGDRVSSEYASKRVNLWFENGKVINATIG
jgi:hypothetical protein